MCPNLLIYYLHQSKLNHKNYRYKTLKTQVSTSKQKIWILKYLEQTNAKLEPRKMKHTQTLVVFKQGSQTDVDFYENPWLLPDSLKIPDFSLNPWLLQTLATLI